MKYVLDTNVVLELMKPKPAHEVIGWFHDFGDDVYLNAITAEELYYGALRLPDGKQKSAIRESIDMVVKERGDQLLAFDGFSSYLCAQQRTGAQKAGRPASMQDCMIAAICQRNDATLVTRNVKDFEWCGIRVVNPFEYESETLKALRAREAEREGRRKR